MEPVACVFPWCDQPARKHGVECRKCYNRIRKRKERDKKPLKGTTIDRPMIVPLDNIAVTELERQRYRQWHDGA